MLERLKEFVREVKLEMKKVSWSSREELTGSTTVVISTVIVVAVYIFAVDWGLTRLYILTTSGVAKVLSLFAG